MIVLDTNVVSETMRPSPDPAVMTWLAEQAIETLYLTTLTMAELLAGVEMMPAGQRRQRVAAALDALWTVYDRRVLPFDPDAAHREEEVRQWLRSTVNDHELHFERIKEAFFMFSDIPENRTRIKARFSDGPPAFIRPWLESVPSGDLARGV